MNKSGSTIYHLKLDRVKKSLMRNGFKNRQTLKILRILENKTVLGSQRENSMSLALLLVYQAKGLDTEGIDINKIFD
jgi:hypothetical protein